MPDNRLQQRFEAAFQASMTRLQADLRDLGLNNPDLTADINTFSEETVAFMNDSMSRNFKDAPYSPKTKSMLQGIEDLSDEDKETALEHLAAFLYKITSIIDDEATRLLAVLHFGRYIRVTNDSDLETDLNPGYLLYLYREYHREQAYQKGAHNFHQVDFIDQVYRKLLLNSRAKLTSQQLAKEWAEAIAASINGDSVSMPLTASLLSQKPNQKAALLGELYATHYRHYSEKHITSLDEFAAFIQTSINEFNLTKGERAQAFAATNKKLREKAEGDVEEYTNNILSNHKETFNLGETGRLSDEAKRKLSAYIVRLREGKTPSSKLEQLLQEYIESGNSNDPEKRERIYALLVQITVNGLSPAHVFKANLHIYHYLGEKAYRDFKTEVVDARVKKHRKDANSEKFQVANRINQQMNIFLITTEKKTTRISNTSVAAILLATGGLVATAIAFSPAAPLAIVLSLLAVPFVLRYAHTVLTTDKDVVEAALLENALAMQEDPEFESKSVRRKTGFQKFKERTVEFLGLAGIGAAIYAILNKMTQGAKAFMKEAMLPEKFARGSNGAEKFFMGLLTPVMILGMGMALASFIVHKLAARSKSKAMMFVADIMKNATIFVAAIAYTAMMMTFATFAPPVGMIFLALTCVSPVYEFYKKHFGKKSDEKPNEQAAQAAGFMKNLEGVMNVTLMSNLMKMAAPVALVLTIVAPHITLLTIATFFVCVGLAVAVTTGMAMYKQYKMTQAKNNQEKDIVEDAKIVAETQLVVKDNRKEYDAISMSESKTMNTRKGFFARYSPFSAKAPVADNEPGELLERSPHAQP